MWVPIEFEMRFNVFYCMQSEKNIMGLFFGSFLGDFFYKVALAVNQDISYASILKVSSEHLR